MNKDCEVLIRGEGHLSGINVQTNAEAKQTVTVDTVKTIQDRSVSLSYD